MSNLSKTFSPSGSHKQSGKLTIPLLISLAICFFSLPAQAKYEGGTGTAGDPYLINTAEQMNQIGANPGDWDKRFELTADIDMNDITETDYNIIETFTGTFDGNDFRISNFSLTSTRQEHTGFFGTVSGTIKDLGLLKPNIFAQGRDVGSLIGYLNQGTITNCYAKGAVVSGGSYVGGLVGENTGTITNCYAKGAVVSGGNYVGGLVGSNTGGITNCCSTGSVSGDAYVGGLVGQIGDGKVTMCYSRAGVSGNRNVGGLVGKTNKETSEIKHSYATGSVEGGINGINVGGLAGQVEQGNTYKCYSTGSVSGGQYVGGLVGRVRVLGIVSRSFWDTQTSGQTTSAGGTGKTTDQMQLMSTFLSTGWDFWNTWEICEGTNYPVLQWQIPAVDFLCPDGVNFIDFAFFADHWGQNFCNEANYFCQGTDLNHSGSVDIRDLKIFTEHWLEGFD